MMLSFYFFIAIAPGELPTTYWHHDQESCETSRAEVITSNTVDLAITQCGISSMMTGITPYYVTPETATNAKTSHQ